jgi:hypothetical protein
MGKLDSIYNKVLANKKEGTCCICGASYSNYGHNAQPVREGRCCDECQEKVVMPARREYQNANIDWRPQPTNAAIAETLRNTIAEARKEFLDKTIEEARQGDGKISKEYLRISETSYRKWQKKMPELWKALMIRRYILPQYRQSDYFHQETCDYLMLDFLMEFTQGRLYRGPDEVLNTQYVSLVRAIEYGRPTFYLEKEFAPVLMKSPLPDDYDIGDIKWRFPSFRVYLPKGFLTIKRKGEDCSMMYLDIVKVDKDYDYQLSNTMKKEIRNLWGDFRLPPFRNIYNGMGVSGNLDFDCPESSLAYAGTTPIDATTVAKVFSITSGHPLITTMKSDELDNEFTNRMIAVALKILMFLSSFEIVPDPIEDTIRKPKMEGDRQITGLYRAKFVGQSALKLTESGARASGIMGTGRIVAPHWVSGHWQRICHGPKHSLRKLVWIGIYHTGRIE